MRKYISLLAIALCFSAMQGQEVSDAYRYAQDNPNGTARFRAMGGAFGAVGGDLSAINVNPAGSVVFANNQIAFSGNSFNIRNKSNYYGKQTTAKNNSLDLNQAGAILVFENNHENKNWKKFSVAINYENANSFDNSLFSAGTNNNNSIDKYFLFYANNGNNGNPIPQQFVTRLADETIGSLYNYLGSSLPNSDYPKLDGFAAQQAMLAFYKQTYIIDVVDLNNPNSPYFSNVTPGGNYYQTNTNETTGYNGKLTFNAATQYKNILMLGINLNTHFIDYKRSNQFTETNNNNTSAVNYLVNKISFNNDFYTYGSGFSMQLGAIVKPTKKLRLGLAYQSPTWYRLSDELTQSLAAVSGNTTGNFPEDLADPNVTVVFPAYKLQTPSKLTGSFAYVFAKRGLLSFDYSMKNYGNLKFSPKNEVLFVSLNNDISSSAKETTAEYSIGGEYKIKQFSLRGGYHFEESPYKNGTTIGDLTSYSGGVGYNFGNTKLDLAYSTSKRDSDHQFFSQGLTDAARINTAKNNVTLTLAFEL